MKNQFSPLLMNLEGMRPEGLVNILDGDFGVAAWAGCCEERGVKTGTLDLKQPELNGGRGICMAEIARHSGVGASVIAMAIHKKERAK